MANIIKPKRNSTATEAPEAGDLAIGEIAVNTADKKIFTKHTDNSIVTLAAGDDFDPAGTAVALAIALG